MSMNLEIKTIRDISNYKKKKHILGIHRYTALTRAIFKDRNEVAVARDHRQRGPGS